MPSHPQLGDVPHFDYLGFPIAELRLALLHMRDLGQALYDLRHDLDRIEPPERRAKVAAVLAERDDLEDDFVEIGFGHLEGRAGFLQHLHLLEPLTAQQQARVDELRDDLEERLTGLRREASAIQVQWQLARRAYYSG